MTAIPSSIMRSAREKVSSPGIADRLLIHAGRQLAATPLHEIEQRFGIAIPESELRFGAVIGMARRFLGLVLAHRSAAPFVAVPGQLGLFTVPKMSLAAAAITEGDLQRV